MQITPGLYRHFSGDLYRVISVGHTVHGDNTTEHPGDEIVVYQAQYESERFGPAHFWVRTIDNFLEFVDHEGERVPRFERID